MQRCGNFKILREFSVQCYINKYKKLTKLVGIITIY